MMGLIVGKQPMQLIRRSYTRGTDGRAVITEEPPRTIRATIEPVYGQVKDGMDGSRQCIGAVLIADRGTFQSADHKRGTLGDIVQFRGDFFEVEPVDGDYDVILPHDEVRAKRVYRD